MPSVALADGCPSADVSYNGNCGPTFTVPNWTDAGGWTDPSKYSTIQLADLNGDGTDELVGRNDEGLEFWTFDTTVGQWRPQVDANDFAQVLTDFASPGPSNDSNPRSPTLPWYSSTIQAVDVDGQPGAEILARFWDGMRVYKYTPPSGGTAINGGTWKKIGTAGPFSDAQGYGAGSLYPTIHVAQYQSGQLPVMSARVGVTTDDPVPTVVAYQFNAASGTWAPALTSTDWGISGYGNVECSLPSCYLDWGSANFISGGPDLLAGTTRQLTARNAIGVSFSQVYSGGWFQDGINIFTDNPSDTPTAAQGDCPFSSNGASGAGSGDCLGSSPSYYETLQGADIDGDGFDEMVARASDGLRVWKYGGEPVGLPTLTALAGAASAVSPGQWGSIRTADIVGGKAQEVLAVTTNGLQVWSYSPASKAWQQLPSSTPLALGADPWLTDPEYYSTIKTGDVDGDGNDDVIARGPYGIRTWFYDRRGTGGWERYLETGYPAWATTGQQNAYGALNTLATTTDKIIPGTAITVRGVWSAETPPAPTDLTQLQSDLVRIAGCTGQAPANPPSYATCTPPSGSTPSPPPTGRRSSTSCWPRTTPRSRS